MVTAAAIDRQVHHATILAFTYFSAPTASAWNSAKELGFIDLLPSAIENRNGKAVAGDKQARSWLSVFGLVPDKLGTTLSNRPLRGLAFLNSLRRLLRDLHASDSLDLLF